MKTTIATLIVALSASAAVAGVNSRKVYESLDVQGVNVTPVGAKDYVLVKKEIGGLICTEQDFHSMLKRSEYSCYLGLDAADAGSIYESLNVEELSVNPTAPGLAVLKKATGNLRCTKSYPVVPNPVAAYTCGIE